MVAALEQAYEQRGDVDPVKLRESVAQYEVGRVAEEHMGPAVDDTAGADGSEERCGRETEAPMRGTWPSRVHVGLCMRSPIRCSVRVDSHRRLTAL